MKGGLVSGFAEDWKSGELGPFPTSAPQLPVDFGQVTLGQNCGRAQLLFRHQNKWPEFQKSSATNQTKSGREGGMLENMAQLTSAEILKICT